MADGVLTGMVKSQ